MHESIPSSTSQELGLEEEVASLLEQAHISFSYFEKFASRLNEALLEENGKMSIHLMIPQEFYKAIQTKKYPQLERLINLYEGYPSIEKYVQLLRREPESSTEEILTKLREQQREAGMVEMRKAISLLQRAGLNPDEILEAVDSCLNLPTSTDL